MQQHKSAEEYISASIPKNIPNNIKKNIRSELESHLEERIEFYVSIGYDKKTAEEKSVEEMGDSNEAKEKFSALYHTSIIPALIFPLAYAIALIFILINGLFLFVIDSGNDPTCFGVFVSTALSLTLLWIIYHSYKKNHLGMLFSVSATMLLEIFLCLFTSSMYQLFIYGINDLLRIPEKIADNITFFGSIVACFGYFILAIAAFTGCGDKKTYTTPPKRIFCLNEKRLAVIFLIITVVLTGNFGIRHGFVSSYSNIGAIWYNSVNDKKCTHLYEEINFNMSYNEVEALLNDNGYININECEEYKSNNGYKPKYTASGEEIVTFIPEKRNDLNKYMIIVPNSKKEPISFKRLDYGIYANDRIIALASVKEHYYKNLVENFDKLKEGMSIEASKQALDVTDKTLASAWSGKIDEKFYKVLCLKISSEEYFYPKIEVILVFENDKLVSAQRKGTDALDEAYGIRLDKFIGDKELFDNLTAEKFDSYGIYYFKKQKNS